MATNAEVIKAVNDLGAKVDENTVAQRKLEKRVAVALAGDIEDPEGKPGVLKRVATLEDAGDSCSQDRGRLWTAVKTICGLVVTIILAIVGWVLAKL